MRLLIDLCEALGPHIYKLIQWLTVTIWVCILVFTVLAMLRLWWRGLRHLLRRG